MPKQSNGTDGPQQPPTNLLEQMAEELTAQLRASGRTVTVTESSDSTEFVVTFPGNRIARQSEVSSALIEPVDLNVACKVLVKSRAVRSLVRKELGASKYPEAVRMMKDGILSGEIGAELHDLLIDTIHCNGGKQVWSGVIRKPHDDYPISVYQYRGIYWVHALEYSPVCYFLDMNSAIKYARENWEGIEESE